MPISVVIGWIAYLELAEEREQARTVEALAVVAATLFAKKE